MRTALVEALSLRLTFHGVHENAGLEADAAFACERQVDQEGPPHPLRRSAGAGPLDPLAGDLSRGCLSPERGEGLTWKCRRGSYLREHCGHHVIGPCEAQGEWHDGTGPPRILRSTRRGMGFRKVAPETFDRAARASHRFSPAQGPQQDGRIHVDRLRMGQAC